MRAAEWLAAFAGATISIAMAVSTAKSQLDTFDPVLAKNPIRPEFDSTETLNTIV